MVRRYYSKPAFYIFLPVFEIIVLVMYAVALVDRLFYAPRADSSPILVSRSMEWIRWWKTGFEDGLLAEGDVLIAVQRRKVMPKSNKFSPAMTEVCYLARMKRRLQWKHLVVRQGRPLDI